MLKYHPKAIKKQTKSKYILQYYIKNYTNYIKNIKQHIHKLNYN